jgi:hypothetical protein
VEETNFSVPLRLALERKQIPRFIGNFSAQKSPVDAVSIVSEDRESRSAHSCTR